MWSKKIWGGFVANRLDTQRVNDGFGGENIRNAPALFANRKDARQQYQDVRPVLVQEIGKDD